MNVLLTGARGYVGSALAAEFLSRNWNVLTPPSGWRLPEAPAQDWLQGVDALVHAAWDMRPRSDGESTRTNVEGSRRLVEAAAAAGVRRLVFISSMSAFEGCVSVYGRRKHSVEQIFGDHGGVSVRPGLVFGDSPGGMVGKLENLVAKLPVVPLPCAGARQFLVHERDLAAYVAWAVLNPEPPIVCSVAHEEPMKMSEIVRALGARLGRRAPIVSVPWQLANLGLRASETLGIPLPVTSDNLIGLAKGNPAPDFVPLRQSGVKIRKFRFST